MEFKKQNKQAKKKKRGRERDKPRNRVLTVENKLMITRGEVGEQIDSLPTPEDLDRFVDFSTFLWEDL